MATNSSSSELREEDLVRDRAQALMKALYPLFQEEKRKCEKIGLSSSTPVYELIRKRLYEDDRIDCCGWRPFGSCRFALHFKDGETETVVVFKHRPVAKDRRFANASGTKHQQRMFTQPIEDSLSTDLFGEPVAPSVCIVIQWDELDDGSIRLEAFKPRTPGNFRQDPEVWYSFGSSEEITEREEFRSMQSAPSIYGSTVSQDSPKHRDEKGMHRDEKEM